VYHFNILGKLLLKVVSTPALPKGRRDRCAFGAVYGGGIAPPPTQPPIIEMIQTLANVAQQPRGVSRKITLRLSVGAGVVRLLVAKRVRPGFQMKSPQLNF